MRRVARVSATVCIAAVIGAAAAGTSKPDAAANAAADVGTNWVLAGLTDDRQNFSPLKQINDKNVGQLGVAWYADIPAKAGLPGTPLIVDGVIYQSGQLSIVYANDLRTGRQLWTFDPKVKFDGEIIPSLGARMNRGLAIWKDNVFVATGDCRLVAVNRKTGQKAWDADVCMGDAKFSISASPSVGGGKVFIGPSNMDDGTRRGFVDAFDAATGKRLWRFYTIPGDPAKGFENKAMERASKTWGKDYWKRTGGGSVYAPMTYDPTSRLLYFGTSSANPDAPPDRGEGRGDELYAASLVAVNADTGEYVWHYQETPDNGWNYDSTAQIVIANLQVDGKPRRVVMHAPKNGYFYMLEAATGKLLAADQYGPKVNWSSGVDLKTGRPIPTKDANFWESPTGSAWQFPGSAGAHNWPPMAFSPLTGLVYIGAMDIGQMTYYTRREEKASELTISGGNVHWDLLSGLAKGTAPLIAWDPVKKKARWRIDDALPAGGGTLATAGNLVFYGKGDGLFRAFAADTGKVLWSSTLPGAIRSTAVTVNVDGKQMVILAIGSDGASGLGMDMGDGATTAATRQAPARLVAFELGGTTKLPPLDPSNAFARPPLPRFPAEMAQQGAGVLVTWGCDYCHGGAQLQNPLSTVPDLRKANAATHTALDKIVLGGAYRIRGMPQFADMPQSDLQLIQAYIINKAWDAYDAQESSKKPSGTH